jgi:(1->4)-alpha-D-glucan 1-alpha-D-glucosylmutase
LRSWESGRVKLSIVAAGLRLRRRLSSLFLEGEYVPLELATQVSGSAVAFARVHGDRAVLFAAPRLWATLSADPAFLPVGRECWQKSRILLPPELAGRAFQDTLTGAEVKPLFADGGWWIELADAFAALPVAILVAR